MMLLAQDDRGQGPIKSYLLERAKQRYGLDNVLHLVPPYSPQGDTKEYFSVIAKQSGFSESITTDAMLTNAFEERLAEGKRLFLLVSGIENSPEEGREEFSGVIRGLYERHPDNFRILICGGGNLADLYFKRQGKLSLLNMAEIREWPELTVADAQRMLSQLQPQQTMSDKTAAELLQLSGGHPRLLQQCLSLYRQAGVFDLQSHQEMLLQSHFVWQLFTPFVEEGGEDQRLCELLGKKEVGQAKPYLVTTSFLSALSKPCGAGPRAKSGEKEGQFRTKKSPKRCVERP